MLVRCELADGTTGWGEGVPRSYVTGETPDGCLAQLAATPIAEQLSADCTPGPTSSSSASDSNRRSIATIRAAVMAMRCAAPSSSAFSMHSAALFGEPVSTMVEHFPPAQTDSRPQQTRCDTASSSTPATAGCGARRSCGGCTAFGDCKVKVGAAGDDDVERGCERSAVGSAREWTCDSMRTKPGTPTSCSRKIEPLLKFDISCVEQPVPHAEVGRLAELRKIAWRCRSCSTNR